MTRVVVYDACSLYGNSIRDLLIRVGRMRLVQPKWTDEILDELTRALGKRPAAAPEKILRLRQLMNLAIPDCLVIGYAPLMAGVELPDPDDRHVLAAAIKAGADTIVTSNIADFPAKSLAPWNIAAQSPDDFVLDLIDLDDRAVFACVQQIVDQRVNPPESIDDVLAQLERNGLVRSAAALRFGWPSTLL